MKETYFVPSAGGYLEEKTSKPTENTHTIKNCYMNFGLCSLAAQSALNTGPRQTFDSKVRYSQYFINPRTKAKLSFLGVATVATRTDLHRPVGACHVLEFTWVQLQQPQKQCYQSLLEWSQSHKSNATQLYQYMQGISAHLSETTDTRGMLPTPTTVMQGISAHPSKTIATRGTLPTPTTVMQGIGAHLSKATDTRAWCYPPPPVHARY